MRPRYFLFFPLPLGVVRARFGSQPEFKPFHFLACLRTELRLLCYEGPERGSQTCVSSPPKRLRITKTKSAYQASCGQIIKEMMVNIKIAPFMMRRVAKVNLFSYSAKTRFTIWKTGLDGVTGL